MRMRRISLNDILLVLLVIISIVQDVGLKFSTFGFTWTVYRLYVPTCMIMVLLGSGKLDISGHRPITKWFYFMLFWVVYGIALLFVGKYSDLHNGFVEWLSIFNGLLVFYLINALVKNKRDLDIVIRTVYWMLNFLLIVGLVEIITGKHLRTSAFQDAKSSISGILNVHQATGFMYNMNDFSALITSLSPVLLFRRFGKKRIISLLLILLINTVNDATTCTLAIILFGVYYFLILVGGKSTKAKLFKVAFWTICVGILIFLLAVGNGLAERDDFIGAFARQVVNAKNSSGSLYSRLVMYKDAIRAWIRTGMFGMGPAGFTRYFTIYPSDSGLVNPHALFLEILTQYGIIIAVLFIGLLIWMFCQAKKKYNAGLNGQKEVTLMVIAFVLVYCVVSFAPSSFLNYSYQWMMLAVVCTCLSMDDIRQLYSLLNDRTYCLRIEPVRKSSSVKGN